jgi:response regulator RpfG family c-di-GMP phosphodiesterase
MMPKTHDDLVHFAVEDHNAPDTASTQKWKLLVVDDDEFVHRVTSLVLRGYEFERKGLTILGAYSAAEAKQLITDNPDTAVLLLDVVMETPQAGLDFADWVRNELGNTLVRIILRTGQPGEAPEQEVIFKYDINDYKEKAELTSQKLYTTVTTAIRSFRDMRTIECSRLGLSKILKASPDIFKPQSLSDFASGVLTQLASTVCQGDDTLMARASGIAAERTGSQFRIIASTGRFERSRGLSVSETADAEVINSIQKAAEIKRSFFQKDAFVGYFRTIAGSETVIYLSGANPICEENKELIEIFSTNISVAFDNIDRHKRMADTQREMLYTIGESLETRSPHPANHVRRMAEYAHLLALETGMDPTSAEQFQLAAALHDIGKIGIPETILLKPAPLDDAELEIVRRHPEIGHTILRNSANPIMREAAVVALQHHERWDGSGYPQGLKGEEITREGRMAMLADVLDSLCCDRPHKTGWPMDQALRFIEENAGTMFEPALVDIVRQNRQAFLAIRQRFPED